MSITSSSPVRRARKRAPDAPVEPDAIIMLREDHKRVAALFRAYGRERDGMTLEEKSALVARICNELAVHTAIEEEIFYPAAREVLGLRGGDLIDEAEVEHASASELIRQLRSASPGASHYDAKVKVLGEFIRHHVEDEHDEVFTRCRKSGMDLRALGLAMAERRAQLDRRN